MHVCLYEREEILVRNVIIQNMLVGLTSNKRMVEMKENGKLAEMREIKKGPLVKKRKKEVVNKFLY
jgi:hypothetical protein